VSPQDLVAELSQRGVMVEASGDSLRYRAPQGVLTPTLRHELVEHKASILRLLTAPPADLLSDDACDMCGSRECWLWLDGRELCRVCLILDLVPMSLLSGMNGRRQ
jgi:TubC N-terminal docking domain